MTVPRSSLLSPVGAAGLASQQAAALGCVEVLGRLAGLFVERRRQLAESVGLTDQQWHALEEVQTEHFMPSLFARERESSAAAVSKILRQLTDKGLVTGQVGAGDARHRSYQVTVRGRETLNTLRQGRQEAIRKVWLPLSNSELKAFCSVGTKVAEQLETIAREIRGVSLPPNSIRASTKKRQPPLRH